MTTIESSSSDVASELRQHVEADRPVGQARPDIDVRRLRHPYEASRFALALGSCVLVGGGAGLVTYWSSGWLGLLALAGVLTGVLAIVWWFVQVYRSKLLGQAAQVTEATFPELHAAVTDIKRRLSYSRPVGIFVISHAGQPVTATSLFGTRVLLFEGGLVADLSKAENRAQLDFVLASHLGALKTTRLWWTPALVLLTAFDLLKFVRPLIAPFQRATVYTGDQVAMVACGGLDEAVVALNRMLVGSELSRSVGMSGVLDQSTLVRRKWLPRLQQLFANEPHLTNRYVNLLDFGDQAFPESAQSFRAGIRRDVVRKLDKVTPRGWRRRGSSNGWPLVGSVLLASALLVVIAYVANTNRRGDGSLSALDSSDFDGAVASTEAPPTTMDANGLLAQRVPATFRSGCVPLADVGSPYDEGIVAAVNCRVLLGSSAGAMQYYQYADAASMHDAFDAWTAGVGSSCHGQYNRGGVPTGGWSCYRAAGNSSVFGWTDELKSIVAFVETSDLTPTELQRWFFSGVDAGPD